MGTQKKANPSQKKVAQSRGPAWRKKLSKGKFEARYNPTLLAVQRQKLDINQNALASKLGLTPATYGSIERAKRPVNQKRAEHIAKIVGMSTQKLFTQGQKNKFVAASAPSR